MKKRKIRLGRRQMALLRALENTRLVKTFKDGGNIFLSQMAGLSIRRLSPAFSGMNFLFR